MNEEKLSILRMVKEGKITPEEGVELLEALKELPEEERAIAKKGKPRFLRILVREEDEKKTKVNVSVPLSLVKWGLKFGPQMGKSGGMKFGPVNLGSSGLSEEANREILDEITSAIDSGEVGKIVEVDEKDSHVEIYFE